MNKILLLLFLLLIILCCKRSEPNFTLWKIQTITTENTYLNHSLIIELSNSDVTVKKTDTGTTFPAIVNDNRMVIETNFTKWLFEIEKTSDSSMILHELYSKNPIEITLVKIESNHKS